MSNPPIGPEILVICGPTAGGKTALSIELAQRLGGECVCADSMQVYRHMDIGTAKPTPDEQAAAPHHLIDLIEPDAEGFSVDEWLRLAEQTIAAIRQRGHHPVVVGGTNLYVQALLYGLFDGPEPDEALRTRLRDEPPEALRDRLEQMDPVAAARIHPNDQKRTIRAIEVYEKTGRPLSDWQQEWDASRQPRPDVTLVGLRYSAEQINPRINARVRSMIDSGLVEEVQSLWAAGRLGRQAREALGYKQIIDHLAGRSSLADAVEQIKILTRRFAKQQRTWLRRFQPIEQSIWIDAYGRSTNDLADTVQARLGGSA